MQKKPAMLSAGLPSTIFEDARRAFGIILAVSVIVFGAMLITGVTIALVSEAGVDQPPSNLHNWLVLISFQVGMIALGLAFARAYGPLPKILSLATPPGRPAAFLRTTGATLAAVVGIMAVYSVIAYTLFPDAVQKDLAVIQRLLSGVPIWLPILVLVIGAPLSEEIVFRGLMLGRLKETRLGFMGATVVSTLSWTLLHLSYTLVGLVDVFVAGLLFSWSLWRTKTLWVPITFHALYNAVVLALISMTAAQPA
jgi:membrane protease YdiL (CAAX protease family)